MTYSLKINELIQSSQAGVSFFRSTAAKSSMMWPSQNFLLYNGTIIKIKGNEWINY